MQAEGADRVAQRIGIKAGILHEGQQFVGILGQIAKAGVSQWRSGEVDWLGARQFRSHLVFCKRFNGS